MGWSPLPGATPGDDTYVGTSGNDGSSSSPISGLGGNDTMSGLEGNDSLAGNAGDDVIDGGTGNDRLNGGDGNDIITDADGNDHIYGGDGDDIITDRDAYSGGTTADGSPYIDAGSGNDLVQMDWKYQNYDTDPFVDGGDGLDTLDISGSTQFGTALAYLDVRNFETLYLHNYKTYATVTQLESFDTIRYSVTNSTTPIELVLFYNDTGDLDLSDELGSQPVIIHNERDDDDGLIRTGAGDDVIYGDYGTEQLYGGAGNDRIISGGGNGAPADTMFGEDGNDMLYGDAAGILYGGAGNDELHGSRTQYGDDGNDKLLGYISDEASVVVDGGAGNDELHGASTQYGGDGNDLLYVGSSPNGARYDGGEDVDTLVLSTGTANYDLDLRGSTLYLIEKLSFGASPTTSAAVAVAHIYASQIGAGFWSSGSIEGYNDSTLDITMGGTTTTDLSGFTNGGGAPKISIEGDGDAETITGSMFRDAIDGGDGADVLAGGKNSDALYGGAGDDTIHSSGADGLAVAETYDGGDGRDTLIVEGPNYTVDFSDDTVTNIEALTFTNPGPFGIGTVRMTADQIAGITTITGQNAFRTGDVLQIVMGDRFRFDLSSAAGYTLTNFSGSSDYVVTTGDSDDEIIVGSDFKDTINANGGADYLDGGAGLDRMFGGTGDDILVAIAGDAVAGETYDGGDGNDVIKAFGRNQTSYYIDLSQDTLSSIERLEFFHVAEGDGYATIVLQASQVGAGLSSTATIVGADSPVTEILAFSMGAAQSLDLSGMTIEFASTDVVSISGDDDAETIIGSGVSDAIHGAGGDDILAGGLGADYLEGGTGNDLYRIDASDSVYESADAGIDTVEVGATYTLGANLENLTLTGAAAIDGTGNALNNVLTGNDKANVLRGLGGNDVYVVGRDDQVFENANEGVDTVKANVDWVLGDNIERLTLTGGRDAAGTGNALANRITGNSGDNQLAGLAENDTLQGKGGDDVLSGGLGRDRLTGGAGTDAFVFDVAVRASNADKIADFTSGEDTLQLAKAVFRAIGAAVDPGELVIGTSAATTVAHDADDFLLYNQTTGQLYYDRDGSGAHAAVLIATLSSHPIITNADFLMI